MNATKRWWQSVPSRAPAAANDRSPSDDIVRGTATVLDAADLRPPLTVASADDVIRSWRDCCAMVAIVVGECSCTRVVASLRRLRTFLYARKKQRNYLVDATR